MIIACHGYTGGVLHASDGGELKLWDLQRIVSGIRAPSFLNKPKIFLVSACRGPGELSGIAFDGPEDAEVNFTNIGVDFYIAHSTIEGYKSWRDKATGSHFLQAVADIWENYYKEETVHDVMTRVLNSFFNLTSGFVCVLRFETNY